MLHLALYQPEIPPNTGNIIRLAANTGAKLHLIYPLGFDITDKHLKRAGLDYHEYASIAHHPDYAIFLEAVGKRRIFALTTKASTPIAEIKYQDEDVFLLGPETRGLPADILNSLPTEQRLRIPMRPESRSLNLSNAAAVIIYEAWRQLDYVI